MADLDEKTKLPLWWIGASLPFLVGAILWMATVSSDAKEAKNQVQELRSLLEDTHTRVIRMEERVNLLTRGK